MNAVVDHSVVLKDVRGTLAADTLEDSGGGDFVIGEEGPGMCEIICRLTTAISACYSRIYR